MPGGLDVRADLSAFGAQLKEVDKKFATAARKNLRAAVSEAGSELVSAMQSAASWSTRIPAATSLAVTLGAKKSSVRIKVDKKQAPHARGLELGNATTFDEGVINAHGGFTVGRDGKRRATNHGIYKAMRTTGIGTGRALKHPVFGRKDQKNGWASMPTRPFFFASVEARTPAVEQKFADAINKVAIESGFKGA